MTIKELEAGLDITCGNVISPKRNSLNDQWEYTKGGVRAVQQNPIFYFKASFQCLIIALVFQFPFMIRDHEKINVRKKCSVKRDDSAALCVGC